MTSPTTVPPQEFVSQLNDLISCKGDPQNGWSVRLESNMMPGTYKFIPISGVPERFVRQCCDVLLKDIPSDSGGMPLTLDDFDEMFLQIPKERIIFNTPMM